MAMWQRHSVNRCEEIANSSIYFSAGTWFSQKPIGCSIKKILCFCITEIKHLAFLTSRGDIGRTLWTTGGGLVLFVDVFLGTEDHFDWCFLYVLVVEFVLFFSGWYIARYGTMNGCWSCQEGVQYSLNETVEELVRSHPTSHGFVFHIIFNGSVIDVLF